MMIDKDRGLRITRRMDALNLTYEELAELCGVSVKAVYKWTAGNNLTSQRVIQLTGFLDCTADYLLLGKLGVKEDPIVSLISSLPDGDRVALFKYLEAIYNKK